MRPTGPGENNPLRPRSRPQWRETARLPPNAWRERAEVGAWHADVRRNGRRRPVRRPQATGVLRGLSGSLAAGLVVLALGLVAVQIWQSGQGEPGPEWPTVIGHLVAATLAQVFQRFADRRRDTAGTLAAVAVFVVVAATLWIWWLV